MADVFLGSVYANLELRNVDGLSSEINRATKSMGGFRDTALGVFGGNLLTAGFAAVTAGVAGFAKTAVSGAADLQSGMSLLQKVTSATGEEMKKFSALAIQLGNDLSLPGISASDATDAMIELGKAGLSVGDTMKAAKGVLQAATAGNISVADSAKLVSGALQAFSLDGSHATKVADLLAAAANASSLDLDQVGFALTQAGAQAAIAGLSLEDTVGVIAQMANAGISAQQAGTSLSYMIKQLMSPTDKAKDVMKELGLSIYDASGNFVGMRETIVRLNEKTKDMTQEQKANAMSTLFGAEAVKAANVLMTQGVETYDKMHQAIQKQNAAQELAAARMTGFNGAMESMKNTFETIAITIGAVLLPALTGMAKFITSNMEPILAGLAAALVAIGVVAFVSAGGFTALGVAMAAVSWPIVAIVAGAAALGAGLMILEKNFGVVSKTIDYFKTVIGGVVEAIKVIATGDFKGGIFGLEEDSPAVIAMLKIHEVMKAVVDMIKGQLLAAWDALVQAFNTVKTALEPALKPLIDFYKQHAPMINQVLKGIAIAFGLLMTPILPLIALIATVVATFTVLAFVIRAVAEYIKFSAQVWTSFAKIIVDSVGKAIQWFVDLFTGTKQAVTDTGNGINSVFTSIGQVVGDVFNTVGRVIGDVFNTIAGIYNATLKPVLDGIIYVVTAIGTIVGTIFTGIAQIIFTVVSTIVQIIGVVLVGVFMWLWNNVLVPLGQVFATVFNAIAAVVTTVASAIWNVITTVFNAVASVVTGVVNTVWSVISSTFNAIWGFLSPILTAIGTAVSTAFNTVKDAISNAINTAWSVISTVFNAIWNTIRTVVGNIVGTVRDNFNNVKNAISEGINGGLNIVRNIVGDFLAAGKNIIDGIVKGVSGGKDAVVGKIKDICAGALDAVKNFFGIHSPSKVMEKMFGYVTKGAEIGLDKGGRSFLSTFDETFNQLPSVDLTSAFTGANMNPVLSRALKIEAASNGQTGNTNIYGDIKIDRNVDQFNLIDQLNRGSVLARKNMTSDV